MNVSKAIKELRKEKGINQADLAEKAGITQAALSMIENGKRPGSKTLENLSKVLGVPPSMIYVMGMEKSDVPKEKQQLYEELFPVIQSLVLKLV